MVMTIIYTLAGKQDKAIDAIEELLTIPSISSVAWFELDPIYTPLRNNPRFRALMDRYRNSPAT